MNPNDFVDTFILSVQVVKLDGVLFNFELRLSNGVFFYINEVKLNLLTVYEPTVQWFGFHYKIYVQFSKKCSVMATLTAHEYTITLRYTYFLFLVNVGLIKEMDFTQSSDA